MAGNKEYWYRMDAHLVAPPVDEFDNAIGPAKVVVEIIELEVLRHTPKGVWLRYGFGKKFVLRDARKRFACPTPKEAHESFFARQQAHIAHLQAKIDNCVKAISKAPYVLSSFEARNNKANHNGK